MVASHVRVPIVEWFNHPMDVPVSTLSLLARFYPWKARATVLRPPHALDECSTGFRDIFDEMAICKRPNESHCICGIAPEQTGTICVEIARETHSLGV